MPSCEICHEQNHKYKCPRCCLKYCSVICYKGHKEKGCEEAVKKIKEETLPLTNQHRPDQTDRSDEYETIDRVKPEVLERLGVSDELKELVSNPHLQTILKHLDTTETPAKFMEAAMKEPIFLEFADKCLQIVEPRGNKVET